MNDPESAITKADQGRRLAMPVVLIGLMGAGKSSVGLRLAHALGVAFTDSDVEIEAAAKLTIQEIFQHYGEAEFRAVERRVITRLLSEEPRIIATGGGAFVEPETRALFPGRALTVWLKADLDVLVSRTAGRTHRPLLNQGDPREILARLIDERYPVYALADVALSSHAGQTHEDMAARIIAALAADGRAFVTESG